MKTQSLFLIATIAACFISCKKNKDEVKDIKTLFSDATWVGEVKFPMSPEEPFCIRFNAGGSFEWYELSGDITGTYTVNEEAKTIQLTFSSGRSVTATVTNNNKLTNFQYGGAYSWIINTAEMVTATTVSELNATSWIGEKETLQRTPILISFNAPALLDYRETGATFAGVIYQLKYACIRFVPGTNWNFFGVINNGKIKGIEFRKTPSSNFKNKWQVTKQ